MNELSKLTFEEKPIELPRLTVKEMRGETLRFFNFEKGIPFTFVSILKNPLGTIKTYLNVDRRKFFNPLSYILIAVGLYTFIISFHKGFQTFLNYTQAKNNENFEIFKKQFNIDLAEPMARAQEIIFSYQNILYLLILPAMGLVTYWLFKKKFNYAEHLAINAFVFGTSTWVTVILGLLTAFIDWRPVIVFTLLPIVSFGVILYLYKKIFETNWWAAIGTMILVYIVIIIIQTVAQFGLMAYLMV